MYSNRRLQKRKRPFKKNGFFQRTALLLLSAAVALSIFTLFVSWDAARKDYLQWGAGGNRDRGGTTPHLDAPRRKLEPAPLEPQEKSSDGGANASNSEIYQPLRTKGRRLLTYRRFGGRLNNQLFQFTTALQHARVLKRTLVVPDEVEDVTWTGMFDGFGIWDLDGLNAAYDIDWKTGLAKEFAASIPKQCALSQTAAVMLLIGGPKLWKEWDEKCPDVIDIDGGKGLLFCGKQQHQFCGDHEAQMEAYKIYDHIKLSPDLMQHIPSRREGFEDRGYNDLAVHSRRAGEGGYDWELCIQGNLKTCTGHITRDDHYKFCDVRTMKGNCAIWSDLEYQIKSKVALREGLEQYRFVLASDGTHDWGAEFDGQFVMANNTEWLLSLEKRVRDEADPGRLLDALSMSAIARKKLKKQTSLTRIRGRLDALTATLLDLFSLVDSKYLLGAYYSTLSLNACLFRGIDRIYDSNMCWMLMHPDSKHAITPPMEESANVNQNPIQDDPLPPALMSDVEHAFVRSNDGNFIAIDRYRVWLERGKQVIGVLGDGLVPMTIVKNGDGKESIRADFTCSYGDQNSPATIVLMKGHQSYHEHYYSRGDIYNTPFSTNGDRFRTMLILCEKLQFDKTLSIHPPLTLQSQDGKFSLKISSTFQHPVGKVNYKPSESQKKDLVHCLSPVYGLKDPRWIIEYLEYHRAIGVSHVHVYNVDLHSPAIQDALQSFRDDKFITRHDWSAKASGGYTTHGETYEHAKWAAQTDCALRSRLIYDYALFSDIDEVAVGGETGSSTNYPEGNLGPALELCEEAKNKKGKIACSFNSNTVTSVYTKLNEDEGLEIRDMLLLKRYDRMEAKPICPYNCQCLDNSCSITSRKFHYGRQKYILNVRDLSIPARPMWTHAIARNYDLMDEIMEVLPDEVMHVRHYQGHWYKNNDLLDTVEEKEAPLPGNLISSVLSGILKLKRPEQFSKRSIYEKAMYGSKSRGVEWI